VPRKNGIRNDSMSTVWFLIALISVSGFPALQYKGYYAYHTQEECLSQKTYLENFVVKQETAKGHDALYVETFCLEMKAFPDQLEEYKKRRNLDEIIRSNDTRATLQTL
jgi:hypothetical protein